jgi:hypothetical protein
VPISLSYITPPKNTFTWRLGSAQRSQNAATCPLGCISSLSPCVRTDIRVLGGQVAGGRLYNPPKYDVHAPDLYLPLMGLFTYVLLSCLAMVLGDRFRPDHLRSQVGARTPPTLKRLQAQPFCTRPSSQLHAWRPGERLPRMGCPSPVLV